MMFTNKQKSELREQKFNIRKTYEAEIENEDTWN